ncbi:MAG: hypothetical protein NVV82_06410 [Sporocytophaga sp.]|nr:hypothetical protein [Sporocytophaga sp.]
MKKINLLFLNFLVVLLIACESKREEQASHDIDTITVVEGQKPKVALEEIWSTDTIFKTPESIIFDEGKRILYVSNVNGDPTKADNNGFISKVSLDGKIENLEWVKGLSAPKGLGLNKNILYVTDINKLVEIDTDKGKIVKTYTVPGAIFLNDVFVTPQGVVYFSDSETNKIHKLENGKVTLFTDQNLNKPNGIFIKDSTLYLASMGSSDFKAINLNTKKDTVLATGIGMGDGVEYVGPGDDFLVSDWEGGIYYISDGKSQKLIDSKEQKVNTADIEFVPSEDLLLVPTFFRNKLVGYKLKKINS